MRTLVLIAAAGAMGLSAFLWSGAAHGQARPLRRFNPRAELGLEIKAGNLGPWSGTAEAQVRPPEKLSPCAELRLEIEADKLGPVASWPREGILLGLFCAYEGDPNPFVIHTAVAQVDLTPPTVATNGQMPPDGN